MKKIFMLTMVVILFNGCKKASEATTSATLKILLISPTHNSILPVTQDVQFTWSSTSTNGAIPITHKIRIVEVKTDQSTDVALRTNKPHFEKDSLNYLIQYPATAVRFVVGSKYAWEIIANQRGILTTGGTSTPSTFTIR